MFETITKHCSNFYNCNTIQLKKLFVFKQMPQNEIPTYKSGLIY
jgi:hypothetical protein